MPLLQPASSSTPSPTWLGEARPGFRGVVIAIGTHAHDEAAYRLIEAGFIEGATVEVLHEGPCGRDPMAVRLGDTTLALRRAEANRIRVSPAENDTWKA